MTPHNLDTARIEIAHIDTAADLYALLAKAGAGWEKPVRRILHLLLRKGRVKTILMEPNPPSQEFADECKVDLSLQPEQCVRLHFFAARLEDVENKKNIAENRSSYSGYCDIRPNGTISKCHITQDVIIHPDSYAFLVCRMAEVVTLMGEKLNVVGFSHIEKNGRGLKCSQLAVANVVQYWNFRAPGTFPNTTAIEISRDAGVTNEQLLDRNFKGLGFTAIKEFFSKQGFNAHTVDYRGKDPGQIEREDPGVTIYGYLESGFPVIAVVKTGIVRKRDGMGTTSAERERKIDSSVVETSGKLHALTVVGHTFDKNVWSALADPLYYSEPLKGGGGYHSNSTWVKHFIVQDDNLGPYFFVPRDDLAQVVEGLVIPMPFTTVIVEPKEAERAAFNGLSRWIERQHFEKDSRLLGANRKWLKLFREHYDPRDREGWVLRPYLRSAAKLVQLHEKHEFGAPIRAKLASHDPATVFWIVELSWPNLYCYDELKIGEIVLDAVSGSVWMVHLPGVLAFPSTTEEPVFARREDIPSACFSGTKGI